jgi:uncharacterized membrane protein
MGEGWLPVGLLNPLTPGEGSQSLNSIIEGVVMEEKEQSSTGLEENVAGFLCYLLAFVTGIVFLVVEKKSSFVKFHAKQSTITFLILLALSWIPFIGFLFWILGIILWLLLMIKALQGKRYSLPIVGKLAEGK